MINHNRKRFFVVMLLAAVIIAAGVFFCFFRPGQLKNTGTYTYLDFEADLQAGNYETIEIHPESSVPLGSVKVVYDSSNNQYQILHVDDTTSITKELSDKNIKFTTFPAKSGKGLLDYLPIVFYVAFFIFFIFIMRKRVPEITESPGQAVPARQTPVTFMDIAGLDEEKKELSEVVSFLKSPDVFTRVGARMPKGVLLIGPPGTGKTFLAKAVAGEAGTSFLYVSGSEFTEKYVGVGASRVRKLFEEAKKQTPCIIFIDEIDAVARSRTSDAAGNDEAAQTLNQILVEMDGFEEKQGIVVIAATNRADILDPALTRAGRFDRKVFVSKPDLQGRKDILGLYIKNKPLAEDVCLDDIAKNTVGFSGAELENLVNEAAIIAATRKAEYMTNTDFEQALIKVGVGTEKKSRIVSEAERRITAYHESGHALLFHFLPEIGPVHMISIVPTGNAGGYTMPLSEQDNLIYTKTYLLNSITALFGGRVAEELYCNDITTGASADLEQATAYARAMVTQYGMSNLGYSTYREEENILQQKVYSETTSKEIDEEVNRILTECHERAKALLEMHKEQLRRCMELLLVKEKLTREEFEGLMG